MYPRHYLLRGLRGRLWCICAAALAAFALASPPPATAQADKRDPVEVFRDALDMDLDNLPPEDDEKRAATRKNILDFREKTLTELASKIVTLRDLSRALRTQISAALRDKKNKDLRLLEIHRAVFGGMLKRFVVSFKKDAGSKDVLTQRATATLAGDLARNDDPDLRSLIGKAVVDDLIPELAHLGESPDPGVQIGVARSMGVIVLELKDVLTPNANEQIRTTILKIQKAGSPGPRRAVIDTTGDLVRLFNPGVGEERNVPKIPLRGDLISLLNLTPILFNGLADQDQETRAKAINVLSRLINLLARDRQILILTPLLSPPPAGRKPTEEEIAYIKENQAELRKELDALRPKFESFRTQTGALEKVLLDPDREMRLAALHTLEDLATVQNYVRERFISLPKDMKDEKPDAIPAGTYLTPMFEKVRPDLIRNLNDPNPKVRLAAAQVFENLGPAARPSSDAIVQRLGDPNPFVRWVAARTLGRLSNPVVSGAVAGLARVLRDPDLSVRIAAANALEALGSEAGAAVPALLASANRGDADYREAALKALGATAPYVPATVIPPEKRGSTIVPVLARELTNPEVTVRRAAARALGQVGSIALLAIDALKKALNDEDSEVRRYASEALLPK
jgi:HEAT repeat protein